MPVDCTEEALVEEWTKGIHNGPLHTEPLAKLDALKASLWRVADTKQLYCERRKLYDIIQKCIGDKTDPVKGLHTARLKCKPPTFRELARSLRTKKRKYTDTV